MTAADWATVASLATALGTLVLAVATFSAVRSGNRTARAAELSLLTTLRPLLTPSRRNDAVLKVNFGDGKWLPVPGSSGVAEMGGGDGTMGPGDAVLYFALSLRNVGALEHRPARPPASRPPVRLADPGYGVQRLRAEFRHMLPQTLPVSLGSRPRPRRRSPPPTASHPAPAASSPAR